MSGPVFVGKRVTAVSDVHFRHRVAECMRRYPNAGDSSHFSVVSDPQFSAQVKVTPHMGQTSVPQFLHHELNEWDKGGSSERFVLDQQKKLEAGEMVFIKGKRARRQIAVAAILQKAIHRLLIAGQVKRGGLDFGGRGGSILDMLKKLLP